MQKGSVGAAVQRRTVGFGTPIKFKPNKLIRGDSRGMEDESLFSVMYPLLTLLIRKQVRDEQRCFCRDGPKEGKQHQPIALAKIKGEVKQKSSCLSEKAIPGGLAKTP